MATTSVRRWLRMSYVLGCFLARLHVSPTAVTVLGVLLCVAVPVAVAQSRPGPLGPLLAAGFVLLAAVADSIDGAVAVVTGRTTRLGYVYDSLADRVGEVCWLIAFWLVGAPGALVVAAGGLSWLHEYTRARSVSAGMKEIGTVTVGERPSRVSVAVVGLLVAGLAHLVMPELAAGTITLATAVWVLLGFFGMVQLLSAVRRSLDTGRESTGRGAGGGGDPAGQPSAGRPVGAESSGRHPIGEAPTGDEILPGKELARREPTGMELSRREPPE
ncbi:CDP-alcohol phosphatidyltransferase [Plantactinospora sp. BC1]|nr:CDP-alcohol phosphatidyltransferase [Plantactinospora sp. BC1]